MFWSCPAIARADIMRSRDLVWGVHGLQSRASPDLAQWTGILISIAGCIWRIVNVPMFLWAPWVRGKETKRQIYVLSAYFYWLLQQCLDFQRLGVYCSVTDGEHKQDTISFRAVHIHVRNSCSSCVHPTIDHVCIPTLRIPKGSTYCCQTDFENNHKGLSLSCRTAALCK